jgi:hypothetical protein
MTPRPFRSRGTLIAARILAASVLAAVTGCTTTTPSYSPRGRRHATLESQISAIRTTAVAPPVITLNQYTAGGIREQRDDWTDSARQAARETLESLRPEKIVYLRDSALTPEIAAEVAEVQALYRTIELNFAIFSDPYVALPTAGRFDFSVGSIDRICEAAGADALLLVYGEDDYFTSDRKALAVVGFAASLITKVDVQPSNGREHLSAALVARDGTLLWYAVLGPGMIGDLRKPDGVKATIQNLLRSMPGNNAGSQ